MKNFNPRSLAGATCRNDWFCCSPADFNPRSLAGATAEDIFKLGFVTIFQSTLPCGSDILFLCILVSLMIISIHAPLRERPQAAPGHSVRRIRFQSTLPCGSDADVKSTLTPLIISIHAPLRERPLTRPIIQPCSVFQSTLPCGSDVADVKSTLTPLIISINAPLRERHLWEMR